MSDDSSAPVIRRLCIAVDAERYSSLDREEQNAAQQRFAEVMTAARAATGLTRHLVNTQAAGDGELALLPPGIDETLTIAAFVRALRDALHTTNRIGGRRLRLRVAMHSGLTQMAANGFAGRAVVTVSRMCESPQLKEHLAAHSEADLVLVLSQSLYEDHIDNTFFDIRADAFEPLTLTVGDRFRAETWVYVPEYRPSPGPAPMSPSPNRVSDLAAPVSVQHNVRSSRPGHDHIHGDVHYHGGGS